MEFLFFKFKKKKKVTHLEILPQDGIKARNLRQKTNLLQKIAHHKKCPSSLHIPAFFRKHTLPNKSTRSIFTQTLCKLTRGIYLHENLNFFWILEG